MERVTIAFISLCLLLLLAQFFMSEGFFGSVNAVIDNCVDASGTKLPCGSSGKCVDSTGTFATCSTTAVINNCMDASGTPLTCGSSGNCIDQNSAIVPCAGATVAPGTMGTLGAMGAGLGALGASPASYDAQFASLRDDIRQTIRDELAGAGVGTAADASYADSASPAAAQGAQFLQEVYGKDPNAYIKKDSIPCYGCSLP